MSALYPMVLPGPVLWGLRERGVLQRAGTVGFPWRVCGRFNFDFERGDATRESLTKLVFEEVSFCYCLCFVAVCWSLLLPEGHHARKSICTPHLSPACRPVCWLSFTSCPQICYFHPELSDDLLDDVDRMA